MREDLLFIARVCAVCVCLIVGADVLLPRERISTEISYVAVNEDAMTVVWEICCSGGEIGSCEVPRTSQLSRNQSILVRRSIVFGRRCSVEPSSDQAAPCKCT